jgi:hypothetical protein
MSYAAKVVVFMAEILGGKQMTNKDIIPDAVTSVDVIQVIRTVAMRGAGTQEDPFRNITQFWTMDGLLIKETDIQTEANEIAREYGQRSANLREMTK